MKFLAIYQCPVHRNFVTVAIEEANGGGLWRHLGGKCCIRQYQRLLIRWRITRQQMDGLLMDLQAALDESEEDES